MIWTILLLLNGLLIIVLLCSRSRRKNEPPLDSGFLPWLGHAIEFGRNPAKFLTRMKHKHGDIFTVRVAGHYVTVLLDPHSYDGVLHDTIMLDSSRYRKLLLKRVFNLELPNTNALAERALMERHFRGLSLAKLNRSMNTHIQTLLLDDCESLWKQEGLLSFCYSLLFRAGYLTLFEGSKNVTAVYEEFRKFDDLLGKLARCRTSKEEGKAAAACQESLWGLLSPARATGESEAGTWLHCYQQYLQQEGVNAEMQRRALLLQLWTTQCNAGPAAFWLLSYLLTHPEAMNEVKAEIQGLTGQAGSPQQSALDTLESHYTPVLDGVLSETLRLTAAAMISREVVQDKTLTMANGQVYHLRKGDRVCLFPFLSPQMDPEIHHQPQKFIYNRFLNEDLTEKTFFYKHGKELKYYNMPWGGGRNNCVGKHFAISTIKQFVFMVLSQLDLKMCDRQAKIPAVNPGRYGFGMLQPEGDLQVCYRLKAAT